MSIFSEHRDFENTKGHGLPMDQAALRFLIEEARSVRILGQPGWTRDNLRVRGSKGEHYPRHIYSKYEQPALVSYL